MLTRFKYDLSLSLVLGFVFCFFFCYALAINPFVWYCGYDQSIFEQVGLGMLQGRIPYVDLFDHKGFLLYLINAIGLWISPGHTGIYCLLSLCLSLTFFCWLQISDILVNPSMRYFPASIALLFACLCEGGNMTETWSLCAISFPIYYLVRYICLGQTICIRECFYIGLCLGSIANLRLNNTIPVFTVCIYMFIELCCKKEFKKLTFSALSVTCGFCVVTLALVTIYVGLYGVKYLENYWFCNIGFNLRYLDRFTHEPLWKAGAFYFPLSMLVIMLCFKRNYHNRLIWFTLLAFLLTLLTTGSAYFAHYFTLFAPLTVLCISLSLGKSLYINPRMWRRVVTGLLILLVCTFGVFHKSLLQSADNFIAREKAIEECSDKLKGLSEKQKSSIWNYNTMMAGANILQCAGVVQCNRIFLPFQMDEQYGVMDIGTLEEIYPEVILVDEYTQWDESAANEVLESRGHRKDSIFISQKYRLLHRCQSLIQKKRINIYIRDLCQ